MNEDALISLAIDRPQRGRYRLLLANPKKRNWLLGKLNHRPPLDPRYTRWFASLTKALASIEVAPSTQVYLLSFDEELDGTSMSFADAVDQVPMHGWGTLIGVSPCLALYYGECGERAAVIMKS